MARGGFRSSQAKAYQTAKATGDFSKLRGGPEIKITGHTEVMAVIRELSEEHGRSVGAALGRTALRSGLSVLTRELKRNAPTHSISRVVGKRKKRFAKLRRVRKAIGSRMQRNRKKNIYEAKAGLNVGAASGRFPQAPAYTIGTGQRRTKRGFNRGRMPSNRFVIETTKRSSDVVEQFMLYRIRIRLPLEVEKVRKRHQARAANMAAKGFSDLPG